MDLRIFHYSKVAEIVDGQYELIDPYKGSLWDTRGVYMRALQIGASNIVVIHNHLSGIPLPSRDDFNVFRRIRYAGELLGIPLVDFIVIGCGDFVSFKEKDLLKL